MINTQTRLFGVIGNPVAHSLGPTMHNAALQAMDYPAVYLAFHVEDPAGAVTAVRALNIGGLSVTIPHKVAIMDHLDNVDSLAERIGAVNTVVNDNGCLTGYNTDCYGAMAGLKEKTGLKGKRAALIGAGGAARAVGFGLREEGAAVVVYNRSEEQGKALAQVMGADFRPWQDLGKMDDIDIIVNTTSVGMAPNTNASPVPQQALREGMVVMDIVYTPLSTRLLQQAEAKGCRTIDGLTMFILQGARQLELWTGRPAPVEIMRSAVKAALEKQKG